MMMLVVMMMRTIMLMMMVMMMMMVVVLEGELAKMVWQLIPSLWDTQGCRSDLQASHPSSCGGTGLMHTASKPSLPLTSETDLPPDCRVVR